MRRRRETRAVVVGEPSRGGVVIGGGHPIVTQSMLTCDTMDTAECVRQTLELVAVGCQLVRITAPTVKDAANLQSIVAELRARDCHVPIVADIHFKPEAALEAARWVEKVRVNPGNYADSKKFTVKEYTDDQYAAELERLEERFAPLVKLCKELGRAMRIGTNHGSLSDRIMNRYGDTPLGMVESALEFARIAREQDYHNFVFSMKASNPKVMIECYRLLVARLAALGPDWNYPIHLGVTEAGEGEDGRIKSAIGIGSLLCDGLGDTIRVSLTEDSPREIAVCNDLLAEVDSLANQRPVPDVQLSYDPFSFERRDTPEIELGDAMRCGGEQTVRVVVTQATFDKVAPRVRPRDDVRPEAVYEDLNVLEVDPTAEFQVACETQLVTVRDGVDLPAIAAFRLLAARLARLGRANPILLKDCLGLPAVPPPRTSRCCARRSCSGRCWPTASGTPCSFGASPAPGSRSGWPSTSCKPPAVVPSRPTMSRVRPAGARCSTSRPSRRGSRPAPSTSRASRSPSWAASSTGRGKWPTPTSATSGARRARSTSTLARSRSNSTSRRRRPWTGSWTWSANTANGWTRSRKSRLSRFSAYA